MNLVIDIGNTRTKFSVFNRGEMLISVPVEEFLPSHVDVLQNEHPSLDHVILSSVKKYPAELKTKLSESFNRFIELDASTPLPIENCYQTKETLGKDRIAAAARTPGPFLLTFFRSKTKRMTDDDPRIA